MKQSTPFTIISFKQTDLLHDMGDDVVFFQVDLEMEGQLYHCSIPFYRFTGYLQENKPADAAYFSRLRRSINGFGPKETVVVRLAEEEGYDIEKAVIEYMGSVNLSDQVIAVDTKQSLATGEGLAQKMEQLDSLAQELKPFNLRDIAFKDEIMDLLNKKVVEIFPEIINSRPEYITELRGLLINHVLNLGRDINKLAWKAYTNP